MRAAMEALTPAERDQLMAARKKAQEDQTVKDTEKAARDAMRAAMLKADPTIGPVLDKIEAAMKAAPPQHKNAKPE